MCQASAETQGRALFFQGGENERQESDILNPDGALPIAWWVGFKSEDDETWERVKNGTYQMFSIEGKATQEPIEKSVQGKPFLELLKYNPNHGKDGKFTSGGANGLTSGAGGGTLQSSQKPIGENGGILQFSALKDVLVRGYGRFKLVKGSKATHIYSFAGKGTKRTADIEKGLMKRFGGKAGPLATHYRKWSDKLQRQQKSSGNSLVSGKQCWNKIAKSEEVVGMKIKYLGETEPLVLTKDKIYEVISIEAEWYRINDDTGEDYLYPEELFEVVEE
ncbi:MAG: XkdF-like putative serine protease domain-containing protein [Oscillospiraceae bacterium]